MCVCLWRAKSHLHKQKALPPKKLQNYMKLLTHNLLTCPNPHCAQGANKDGVPFPLILEEVVLAADDDNDDDDTSQQEQHDRQDQDDDSLGFTEHFMRTGRLDYAALQ